MAFANPNIDDITATTIESRSGELADNILGNNALFAYFKQNDGLRFVDGGSSIMEELMFAENANAMWYSGGELLNISSQDVISAASYSYAQAACAVSFTGLDELKNSGKERIIELVAGRVRVAEKSMQNLMSAALYSDGTAFGGKQLAGLGVAAPTAPTVGTYGGINRATFPFWQPQLTAPGAGVITAANINVHMNDLWVKCTRGKDHPRLIVYDNAMYKLYLAFLQNLVRFTDPKVGKLGFPSVNFIDAEVILDGGIGGDCPANTGFFLNPDYIFLRPHRKRWLVPLNPASRSSVNQDLTVKLIGFAGQLTVSNESLQGRIHNN